MLLRAVSGRHVRALPTAISRAQVHLLANTLSLAGALVHRRPEAAGDLLAFVTGYLRSQMQPVRPLVTLGEELRLALPLVGIQRARLGSRLRLDVACTPDALEALVPAMVLQPLVENAIHHGINARIGGGTVRISARIASPWLHVAVSDDGVGVRRPLRTRQTTGFGLATVRLRLLGYWGSAARFRLLARPGGGTIAAFSVPATFA